MSDYDIDCNEHDLECRMEQADFAYDMMRDDFLLCKTESDAISLIKRYGLNLSSQHLPIKFHYLLETKLLLELH